MKEKTKIDKEKNTEKKIQCPYCGSWIEKQTKKCPFCTFDFKEKTIESMPDKKIKTDFKEKTDDLPAVKDSKTPSKKSSLIFFSVIFVVMLLILISAFYALGVNVFDVETYAGIFSAEGSVEDNFDGQWKKELTGAAAKAYEENWFFYDNGTLKVEKITNSKSSEEKKVFVGEWQANENQLMISGEDEFFSFNSNSNDIKSSDTIYLTVFKYSFSKNCKKMCLDHAQSSFTDTFNRIED